MHLQIKTHRLQNHYTSFHFFILSKGSNSGKPLNHPCPNCFVIEFDSAKEREQAYWICFGLWQGKAFYPYLTGSVIPFIHINDLRDILETIIGKRRFDTNSISSMILQLRKIEVCEEQLARQSRLIGELKIATCRKLLDD